MFRRKKPEGAEGTLRTLAEVAGEQIAPGAGTWLVVLGGLAAGAAAAYLVRTKLKNRKAAE